MGITNIQREVPCETEPATIAEARASIEMLLRTPMARRIERVLGPCLVTAEQVVSLDTVAREVSPRTVILASDNLWLAVFVWLFVPSCEEIVTFSSDIRGEQVAEIVGEVLFDRFVHGDPVKELAGWPEGAELLWVDGKHSEDATAFLTRFPYIQKSRVLALDNVTVEV